MSSFASSFAFKRRLTTFFSSQFALNMAWTPLFFGARLPLPALFDIALLSPVTYVLTAQAYKIDPRTAIAFVPYCAWLSYATYLNGASSPLLVSRRCRGCPSALVRLAQRAPLSEI